MLHSYRTKSESPIWINSNDEKIKKKSTKR